MQVEVGYIQKQKITVSIRLPPKKMQLQVPNTWTINKLKCMVQTQLPMMEFNKFQLVHQGMVLKGSYPLKIYTPKGENKLILSIIKMQAPGSFEEYYQKRMDKFFRRMQQQEEDQFNTDTDDPVCTLPLNNDFYQEAYFRSKGLKYNRVQNNLDDNANANNPEQNVFLARFFRLLDKIGRICILLLIWFRGSYQQIAIILGAYLAYHLVDWHVKTQEKKRQQNHVANEINDQQQREERNNINQRNHGNNQNAENQMNKNLNMQNQNQHDKPEQLNQNKTQVENIEQKKERRQYVARFLLYTCFLIEFFYCFFFSLFPNWTIQTHFQANRALILETRNKIEGMDQELKGKIKFQ